MSNSEMTLFTNSFSRLLKALNVQQYFADQLNIKFSPEEAQQLQHENYVVVKRDYIEFIEEFAGMQLRYGGPFMKLLKQLILEQIIFISQESNIHSQLDKISKVNFSLSRDFLEYFNKFQEIEKLNLIITSEVLKQRTVLLLAHTAKVNSYCVLYSDFYGYNHNFLFGRVEEINELQINEKRQYLQFVLYNYKFNSAIFLWSTRHVILSLRSCNINNLYCSCENIEQCDMFDNSLKTVKFVSTCSLYGLNLSLNQLTALDLAMCPKLKVLLANHNELSKMDLSTCKNIRIIDMSNNNLSKINVGECALLEELNLSNNKLQSIDISFCGELEELEVEHNNIEELLVDNCRNMEYLSCYDNNIKELNLHKLFTLFCVEVDDFTTVGAYEHYCVVKLHAKI